MSRRVLYSVIAGVLAVLGTMTSAAAQGPTADPQSWRGEWRWKAAFERVDMILRITDVQSDGTVLGEFDTQNWGKSVFGSPEATAKIEGDRLRFFLKTTTYYDLTMVNDGLRGHFYRSSDHRMFDVVFVRPDVKLEAPAGTGRLYFKSGETADLHTVYWARGCNSALIGVTSVSIVEGPPGLTMTFRPENVKSRDCGQPIPGATLVVTAPTVAASVAGKLAYVVRYKTTGGDEQSTHSTAIEVGP